MIDEETLSKMEDRAQRLLDGMTVNRDVLVRDVLLLIAEVRGNYSIMAEYENGTGPSSAAWLFDSFFKDSPFKPT